LFGPIAESKCDEFTAGKAGMPLREWYVISARVRNPITGIVGCCARAARGHAAAAPPTVAKNFRRPMWLAM
jgi:hypothetical protein